MASRIDKIFKHLYQGIHHQLLGVRGDDHEAEQRGYRISQNPSNQKNLLIHIYGLIHQFK